MGLLTQLMNPDPEIFPVGHPYRRGYSSSEIRGVGGRASASRGDRDRGFKPLQPLMDVKATKTDNTQDNKLDKPPSTSRPEATVHRKSSSSAVLHSRATTVLSPPARTLRPKGRPQDQELEDESRGRVWSKSAAQEKLKATGREEGDRYSWESINHDYQW